MAGPIVIAAVVAAVVLINVRLVVIVVGVKVQSSRFKV